MLTEYHFLFFSLISTWYQSHSWLCIPNRRRRPRALVVTLLTHALWSSHRPQVFLALWETSSTSRLPHLVITPALWSPRRPRIAVDLALWSVQSEVFLLFRSLRLRTSVTLHRRLDFPDHTLWLGQLRS